jgi:hypothetical protein
MQVVPSPRRFDNPRIWRTVVGTLRYSLPYFGMPDRGGRLVCPTTVLSAVGPGAIHKLRRGPLKSVADLYGLASSGQPPNCHLFLILATDRQSPEAGRKETDAEGGSGIDLPHGR